MIIHDVQQGSPEWHALRNRIKHTASDLAAIRGNSKYKTRTQAIREAATGIKPEVSEFQQKKFDEGHATEAAARVIVEKMIGEDLYPTVATTDDEYLLSSSDGHTMAYEIGYEHKLWNEELAAAVRARQLEPHYTDQMDQQIAVYGFERIIFVTSDGTENNFEWMEYTGNPESIARIRADWERFDEDVANYQPEVIEAKPILTANHIDNLPALVIEVTGRVTHSNLSEFKAAAVAVIGSIKQELVTDQDFVDATAAVKYLKDVEDNAKRAKQNALDQTESIATLHRALDEVAKMAGDVRKALDKKITEEKDRRKSDIVRDAQIAFNDHYNALSKRVGVSFSVVYASFADAIKGLKSLDSMRDKVSVALDRAKGEADAIADRIDANRKTVDDMSLFPDFAAVCTKPVDDFAALLAMRAQQRKDAEEKRLEAEREHIRAEEQAKAQSEANEKAAAEIRRLDAERKAAAELATAVNEASATGTGIVQMTANDTECVSAKHIPVETILPANACLTTIKLGEINARLGVVNVTADQLASLGVHPVATEKNAKIYDAAKFTTICRLISEHVMALAFKKAS